MTQFPKAAEDAPNSLDARAEESLALGSLGARLRRMRLPLLVSLVTTLGCLWLLRRGALPIVPEREQFVGIATWGIPVYTLLFVAGQFFRAYRWRYLLRPVHALPDKEVLSANAVFFASLIVLPLRLGELVRPALLRRKGALSGWQVLGLAGAERVVDGLCSSLLLLSSLLLSAGAVRADLHGPSTLVRPMAFVMVGIFSAALVAVLVFFFARHFAVKLLERTIGLVSPALSRVVAEKVGAIAGGLHFLRTPTSGVPFLICSSLYWGLMALSMWALFIAAGVPAVSIAQAGTVVGVLALGLLVPGAPGFFGTFQVSVYAGLSIFLAPESLSSRGATVVFILYVVQMLSILLGGAFALRPALRALSPGIPSSTGA